MSTAVHIPPRKRSFTNERRDSPISHQQAREAAVRLIHSHFGTVPHARVRIPMSLDDDDVLLLDYIEQQQMKEAGN